MISTIYMFLAYAWFLYALRRSCRHWKATHTNVTPKMFLLALFLSLGTSLIWPIVGAIALISLLRRKKIL